MEKTERSEKEKKINNLLQEIKGHSAEIEKLVEEVNIELALISDKTPAKVILPEGLERKVESIKTESSTGISYILLGTKADYPNWEDLNAIDRDLYVHGISIEHIQEIHFLPKK